MQTLVTGYVPYSILALPGESRVDLCEHPDPLHCPIEILPSCSLLKQLIGFISVSPLRDIAISLQGFKTTPSHFTLKEIIWSTK